MFAWIFWLLTALTVMVTFVFCIKASSTRASAIFVAAPFIAVFLGCAISYYPKHSSIVFSVIAYGVSMIFLDSIIPERASKNGNAMDYVTGWILLFKKVTYYQGPAGRYNSFLYRLLGLSNFTKGYAYRNLSIGVGSGPRVQLAYCIIASDKSSHTQFWDYELMLQSHLLKRISYALEQRSEDLVSEVLSKTKRSLMKKANILVEYKRIEYYFPPKKLSIYCP